MFEAGIHFIMRRNGASLMMFNRLQHQQVHMVQRAQKVLKVQKVRLVLGGSNCHWHMVAEELDKNPHPILLSSHSGQEDTLRKGFRGQHI